MVHRVPLVLGGFTATLALAGCGGSTGVQAASPTSTAAPTAASEPAARPDKLTGPASTDRDVTELTGFVSPTGNVACMLDADWARCDIIDRDWAAPARPADCEFDYGQGIALGPGEQAQFVCAGDTAFGPDEVLPYGDSIKAGVLRCESAASGVACRDIHTGHGFSISVEAYRLF
jgi:Family of unknown function (DUF6636)